MQPEKLDLAYPRRNVSQLKEEVDRLSNSVHNLQKNIQTDNLKNNIGNIKNNAGVIPMHKEGKITPKCDIDGRDALSAIDRAKTLTCKQEIADVFCKSKEGKLFPPRLPRYCPLQGKIVYLFFKPINAHSCHKQSENFDIILSMW